MKKTFSLEEANLSINELKPESEKKVSATEKKVRFKSEVEIIPSDSNKLSYSYKDSGYGSLLDEEPDKRMSNYQEKEAIYATGSKKHIEAIKRT